MPPGEQKSSSKNSIPPALQDLLVREAAFALSRNRIGDAVTVARQARDVVAAARPLLSFVRQDAKKDHREKLREAEENVSILEAGAKKLDATIPVLHVCVERSVENYLREMDPEYVVGLSASRFSIDWQRILERYEQAVELYIGALEQLPGILQRLVPHEICGAHFDGRQLIEDTAKRAEAVLSEIAFINKIAEAQRLRGGNSGTTLERQPGRNWSALAKSLLAVTPLAAARTVKTLFAESKDLVEQVHAAIKNEGRQATYAGGYGVTSYHDSVWVSLREAALTKLSADRLEQILDDTEKRLETGTLAEYVPEPSQFPASAVTPTVQPAANNALRVTNARSYPATAIHPFGDAPTPALTKSLLLKVPVRPSPVVITTPNNPNTIPVAARPTVSLPTARPQPLPTTALAAAAKPEPDDAALAELRAERERLDKLLVESKASMNEREQVPTESEARLMQTSQAQLEREMELEQREEQLRDLEKRLRQLQPGLLPPVEEVTKKARDEFNE